MDTKKAIVSALLATLSGVVTIDAATAHPRTARTDSAAKAAAVTSTPAETEARETSHQENQDSRQDRWNDASPNQKAVTYNASKSKQQQKVKKQDATAAAVSKRR